MNVVKSIYKDLVTVGKDPDTGDIKIYSHVFSIEKIDGIDKLYMKNDHP